MYSVLKSTKVLVAISIFGIVLSGCQSIATTGTSTHSPKTKQVAQLSTDERKANWDERVASIREKRQARILETREKRLAAVEKRKTAIGERKRLADKRREETKAKLTAKASGKKVKDNKNQKKINQSFAKAKDSKDKSLRTGWVRIDGKFVYRTRKDIIAEQEAAKKAAAAAKRAAARRVASKRKATRKSSPKSGNYNKLIAKYAAQNGVPYRLARAVVQVESSFRPNVTGGVGEIGLMQIRLATARGMGYKGSAKQLYNPATNLFWGMKYLGKAHRLAGGSTCGTILKYNAGHGATRPNPISTRYCQRVRRIIA